MNATKVDIHLTITVNEKGPQFNYTGDCTVPDPNNVGQLLQYELPATEVVAHVMEFTKALAMNTARLHEAPTILVPGG